MSDSYRQVICGHGFPAESCPLCGAEPWRPFAVLNVWDGGTEAVVADPGFALAEGWEPELCKSPEYQLTSHTPPLWWRKRDRDAFYDGLEKLRHRGVIIW